MTFKTVKTKGRRKVKHEKVDLPFRPDE